MSTRPKYDQASATRNSVAIEKIKATAMGEGGASKISSAAGRNSRSSERIRADCAPGGFGEDCGTAGFGENCGAAVCAEGGGRAGCGEGGGRAGCAEDGAKAGCGEDCSGGVEPLSAE